MRLKKYSNLTKLFRRMTAPNRKRVIFYIKINYIGGFNT